MGGNAGAKILPVIGTVVGSYFGYPAAGAALGGLAGAAVERPTKLPVPPVVPMPDQSMIDKAKQDSLMSQFARRGRASTVLTGAAQDTGKLGG